MSVEHMVTSVLKAPNVHIGPPVIIGTGSPVISQAEAVASAAWSKSEVPGVFRSALSDVNLDPAPQDSLQIAAIAVLYNSPPVAIRAGLVPEGLIPKRIELPPLIPSPLIKPE